MLHLVLQKWLIYITAKVRSEFIRVFVLPVAVGVVGSRLTFIYLFIYLFRRAIRRVRKVQHDKIGLF